MLTLPDLTAGPVPVLRRPEPAAEATAQQQLDDVVVCDARWRLPPEDAPRVRAGLAVLPTGPEGAGPEDAGAALRQLARAGVVAVVPAPATAPARELLEQADRAGLPVLLPAGPWDAHETLRRVLRRQLAVERETCSSARGCMTASRAHSAPPGSASTTGPPVTAATSRTSRAGPSACSGAHAESVSTRADACAYSVRAGAYGLRAVRRRAGAGAARGGPRPAAPGTGRRPARRRPGPPAAAAGPHRRATDAAGRGAAQPTGP
ncbi:PucR family transcriptional regulator ligand-binding domain-containing protein [Streptomyces sp. CB02414]|uniref:PucR family transcriptional regulator ligand-binding domain-containing protein n=1 Tax=Streptomyces sp. CB02414 TaxID=1703922 RepID=UPI001F528984|nr:PucR family transcriptional regulator ligand-binding domain-containing protein [Streptomyces sp. CB02414]